MSLSGMDRNQSFKKPDIRGLLIVLGILREFGLSIPCPRLAPATSSIIHGERAVQPRFPRIAELSPTAATIPAVIAFQLECSSWKPQ